MSSAYKQYLRAKNEVESSLVSARNLRDQWLATTGGNPMNLTKKDIDYIGKKFKNKLLTVKWDLEDLEDMISVCENETNDLDANELEESKRFISECKNEISKLMDQLEETESNFKTFNKHGISFPSSAHTAITSMIQNQSSKYERLKSDTSTNININHDAEEVQFDKGQVASSAAIFNNALYDHFEEDKMMQSFDSSQVFNNLSRPITNVYVNPNENEIILDTLETEYYNPPGGLQHSASSRLANYSIRKLLETDRNKFFGAVAFVFSLPIMYLVIPLIV